MDVPSGTMRDNIMPLPYKEPSQVLASLMNQIIEDGRRFAGTVDLNTSRHERTSSCRYYVSYS
jgi:hypothetical protein